MEKMLVTQALNELKNLDSRIDRSIRNTGFIAAAKTLEKNVTPNISKDKYCELAKAGYQSVVDLIERRKKIKTAIVESNAKNVVSIGGKESTVANAIERKSSIQYEKDLLSAMEKAYNSAMLSVTRNNLEMETKIDKLVEVSFGKEQKTSIDKDEINNFSATYRKSNEYSLVDPLDLKNKIEALKIEIEEFEANVDSVLQVSNCISYIEF